MNVNRCCILFVSAKRYITEGFFTIQNTKPYQNQTKYYDENSIKNFVFNNVEFKQKKTQMFDENKKNKNRLNFFLVAMTKF